MKQNKSWKPNKYKTAQKEQEFKAFLNTIREQNCQSYLEIGARHGGAFYEVVTQTMPKGATCVAVDLPGGAWGIESSQQSLKDCVQELISLGYDAHVVFGDSTETKTIVEIERILQRYDAVFIDGDHRFAGVKTDWQNYSPIANKLVAFHDIAGRGIKQASNPELLVEVPEFWDELKATTKFAKYLELIDSVNEKDRPMGIGIVLKD